MKTLQKERKKEIKFEGHFWSLGVSLDAFIYLCVCSFN